jgi:hypothetical protein
MKMPFSPRRTKRPSEVDGCIVIENVLDKCELDRLKAELRPHFDETPNCTGDFYGHATKRVSSLIAGAHGWTRVE